MKLQLTGLLFFVFTVSLPLLGESVEPSLPPTTSIEKASIVNSPQGVVSYAEYQKSLEQVVNIEFSKMELQQVVKLFSQQMKISLIIDPIGLEEAGVTLQKEVSLQVKRVRIRSALDLLLKPLNLAYLYKNDGLFITSKERADEELVTKVYDCTDILSFYERDADEELNFGFGFGSTGLPPTKEQIETAELKFYRDHPEAALKKILELRAKLKSARKKPVKTIKNPDFCTLNSLISSQILPDSWLDNGGKGVIDGYLVEKRGLIVISQTLEVHEQIENLLAQLKECSGEKQTQRKKTKK